MSVDHPPSHEKAPNAALDRDAYRHDRDTPWPPVLPEPILPPGDRNENPPGLGFWALLREDRRTHENEWFSQGYWALTVNRFGNWKTGLPRSIRWMFRYPYLWLRKIVQWTCGIKLDYTVKVGRRVHLWHFGGMILGAQSIGDDVQIRQNTTLGVRKSGDLGKPIIQDRVEIGCGCVILGNVVIGHDSKIGANSVVTSHIPPYSVAVGAPARVVKTLTPKADDASDGVAAREPDNPQEMKQAS